MAYRNILLIDDDEDDQDIFLTAAHTIAPGAACTVESNGYVALQHLERKLISPDVIFLDLNMPEMNGQQFLFEVKKRQELKHIPVIILSTSSHAGTIALTKEMGAYGFLTKPDKFDELVVMLRPIIS